MYSILDIQKRLADRGFDPGPLDGIRGRRTIAAVKAFQAREGIRVDGLVGPETLGRMFGPVKANIPTHRTPDAAPWLDIARRKMGLHEARDHGILSKFLKSDGKTLGDPAKQPWCGDFVETCIALALPDEILPDNPYAAINWLKFGKLTNAKPGAVLVFWRGSPSSWQGHVGFYVGEDATHFHVLGGNQSNAITIARIARGRLRDGGIRWPLTAMESRAGAKIADGTGLTVTTNEV